MADIEGLSDLAEAVGKRFLAGVLLYQETTVVPIGPKGWAVPLGAMFAG